MYEAQRHEPLQAPAWGRGPCTEAYRSGNGLPYKYARSQSVNARGRSGPRVYGWLRVLFFDKLLVTARHFGVGPGGLASLDQGAIKLVKHD